MHPNQYKEVRSAAETLSSARNSASRLRPRDRDVIASPGVGGGGGGLALRRLRRPPAPWAHLEATRRRRLAGGEQQLIAGDGGEVSRGELHPILQTKSRNFRSNLGEKFQMNWRPSYIKAQNETVIQVKQVFITAPT